MKNAPDADALLAIARETHIKELLPALPEHLRYTALMVANALAIAQRELRAGSTHDLAELGRLGTLLPETPSEMPGGDLQADLVRLNRHLAHAIRAGRYDARASELLAHLRKITEEKLAISNPKALAGP